MGRADAGWMGLWGGVCLVLAGIVIGCRDLIVLGWELCVGYSWGLFNIVLYGLG